MALDITCGSPPDGNIGVPYTYTFPVSGAAGHELVFTITAGSLPEGLTLNPSTGVISGTPTIGGIRHFTISVNIATTGVVDAAILHVTTSQTGTAVYAYETSSLVSANGVISPSVQLANLHNLNSSPPFPTGYTWPKTTNDIDVLHGTAVTFHPELKLDVHAPNLAYPVSIFGGWRGLAIFPANLDLNIYSVTMDVHRDSGSSATLFPVDYSVIYADGIDASNPYNRVVSPGLAADRDDTTFGTIHREAIYGVWYPIIEVGRGGWYAPGDSADCSIRIIGPGNWLDLWVWRQLFSVSSVTQELAFPPGYERALRLQLAADLGRSYPGRDLTNIKKQLAVAVAAIETENVTNSLAIEEPPAPPEET